MPKQQTDSYSSVLGDKQNILVVTAHPDDAEVVAGGLIARARADKKQIRIVVTTNGEKGNMNQAIDPKKLAKLRLEEQVAAAKQLGIPANQVFNLGYADGELEPDLGLIKKIVYHIREFKPDIIITHCPDEFINTFSSKEGVYWINHRDHRHTAQATIDAIYPYSIDTNFFPEQLSSGLSSHKVSEVLLSDAYEHPMRKQFKISGFEDKKRAALAECKSVIPADHVDDYIDETKIGNDYFETLRHIVV